jgi:hypothetical protein
MHSSTYNPQIVVAGRLGIFLIPRIMTLTSFQKKGILPKNHKGDCH